METNKQSGRVETTPHTPPTQAELDEWRRLNYYPSQEGTIHLRLIAEVERLRAELTMNQGVWQIDRDHEMRGAQSECACPSCNLHRHIARLTKEVEELRKDKERLDWLEKEKPNIFCLCTWDGLDTMPEILPQKEPTGYVWEINDGIKEEKIRHAIDAAMQQKGEE